MSAPLSLVILLQSLRPVSRANPLSTARPFVTKEMLNMCQTVNPDPFHPKYAAFLFFFLSICAIRTSVLDLGGSCQTRP